MLILFLRKRQSRVQDLFYTKNATVCTPHNAHMAAALTDSILNMIVKDMRPISVVESQGFREMIYMFYPGYTLPSRFHFTDLMEKKYEENFERVKASLKEVKTKVSLTADAWTSIATEAYLGVTCHFNNEDWELTSYNLTTMPLEDRHTAENIATWVEKVAEKFEIHKLRFRYSLCTVLGSICWTYLHNAFIFKKNLLGRIYVELMVKDAQVSCLRYNYCSLFSYWEICCIFKYFYKKII